MTVTWGGREGQVDTLDFISCSIGNPVCPVPLPKEFKGSSDNWALLWGRDLWSGLGSAPMCQVVQLWASSFYLQNDQEASKKCFELFRTKVLEETGRKQMHVCL